MEHLKGRVITVENIVNVPAEKAWEVWTSPKHITGWNFASNDWQSSMAINDLKVGGKFNIRMEAKDGSNGFDFSGTYTDLKPNKLIAYEIDDGRKVVITFSSMGKKTLITESFEAESTNPVDLQQNGWQSILDNFKKYAESI